MEKDTNKDNGMSETTVTTEQKENGANDVSKGTTAIEAVTKNNIEAIAQTNKDVIIANLAILNDYKVFAESIKDTDLGQRFAENITVEGKVVSVININNMVTCLLIGKELGLSPMVSLSYGRGLNLDSIQKIELGQALGLSTTAALKNIFVFETGGNRQVYTGINVVEGCLNKHNIDIHIDEDFVPVYEWFNIQLGKPIVEYNPERHVDVDSYNDAYVKQAMTERGCIPVTRIIKTYRTTVTLTRKGKKTTMSYTLQEAIDAGLKSGKNSVNGSEVKGKDNWDKHTRSLMRKMAIMIASRICANDILNGMYSDFELVGAPTIPDDTTDTKFADFEEVKD